MNTAQVCVVGIYEALGEPVVKQKCDMFLTTGQISDLSERVVFGSFLTTNQELRLKPRFLESWFQSQFAFPI